MKSDSIDLDNFVKGTYDLTNITELRTALGSSVSVIDLWFPHVSKAIVCSWGTEHFMDYTKSLIATTRPNREGFPIDILAELTTIIDTHNETFPQYTPIKSAYL